jgi:hypothetical protein
MLMMVGTLGLPIHASSFVSVEQIEVSLEVLKSTKLQEAELVPLLEEKLQAR